MATNYGRHLQKDLHSAARRSETDRNMTVPIQKYSTAILHLHHLKYGQDRSSNRRDYEANICTILDETVKFGISHQITQQLLDRSLPYFQH